MNSKIKLLLASLVVASLSCVYADDSVDAETRGVKHYKCLRVGDLRVCNDELIDGDLTVAGTITAANGIFNDLTINNDLTIGGDIVLTGTVIVDGVALIPSWGEVGALSSGLTITIAPGDNIDFTYATPLFGMAASNTGTAGAVDGLVLGSAGVYLFQYAVTSLATVGSLGQTQVQLTSNDAAVPNSAFSTTLTPGLQIGETAGFVISEQPAGAVIRLNNPSTTASITLTTTAVVSAKLAAVRIG